MAIGYNPAKGKIGSTTAGGGVNDLAAGSRVYGQGRPYPNMGKTTNKAGYGKRDAQNEARKNALKKRVGGL